jgi:glycosyltransferase involved in cell wall biosynthesis
MKLSVLLLAYNHEKYIVQALESILMQQVTFDYEVVIGEDCSLDKTREIVVDYQRRHPNKIRLLLPEKNLGAHENFLQTFFSCKGEYIALLEGDDYWTSPHKLQRQIELLDNNPDCAMCFHDAHNLMPDGTLKPYIAAWGVPAKHRYRLEDIAFMNFIPTCSVVVRNHVVEKFPEEFYKVWAGDWIHNTLQAQHGDLFCINEAWGVRRVHGGGLASGKNYHDIILANVELIKIVDKMLGHRYAEKACERLSHFRGELERTTAAGHPFLNPPFTPENADLYLVRTSILRALGNFLPSCKGIFLDIGCGEVPYKAWILTRNYDITNYIGLDIENPLYQGHRKPDLFWDGKRIPLGDNSVDCAMATELFEHLPDPEQVMAEICRVLKPDGKIFFTVPFLWSLHTVPHDEYRYTPFSLERHLKNSGFSSINIKALGGWDASLAQVIGLWVRRKPMAEEQRKSLTEQFFPFYKQLIESDTLPEGFPEGQLITGLSGVACKPLSTASGGSRVPERPSELIRSDQNFCLAVFTPNIGTLSETFIHRQIELLAPERTVVISGNIFDVSVINCPILKIPYSEGPATYTPDVEKTVKDFLIQHGVTHILCEYGCYGTEIVELNDRKLHLPLYVHFHGGDAAAMLRNPAMVEYYRWMGQRATGIIAVAIPMAERLAAIGIPRHKLHIAHYGVEIPEASLSNPDLEPCSFLAVGRLVAKKGPVHLLKAFAKAREKVPSILLNLIGDGFLSTNTGGMRQQVDEFLRSVDLGKSVTLHGAQPHEYVKLMMGQSSVFVQHSLTDPETGDAEGLPNSILEASAAGLPIISTRHEGIPEEVEEGVTGLLVDEQDIDDMAFCMVRLALDPALRIRMGVAAREKIKKEFSLSATINNLRRIMNLPNFLAETKLDEERDVVTNSPMRLYAGDVPDLLEYEGWIGLSLTQENDRHIRHDITQPLPFSDNSVDSFQAEDVFEHIHYDRLVPVVNEIHRILKPGGLFRLSVPDYGCDVLRNRSLKDALGNIMFDPEGGGTPERPGHVWFPRVESVYRMLEKTRFFTGGSMDFLHYWNMDDVTFVTRPIDYSKGIVRRTPDFDDRVKTPYRPMSLVVDLIKHDE